MLQYCSPYHLHSCMFRAYHQFRRRGELIIILLMVGACAILLAEILIIVIRHANLVMKNLKADSID